MYVCRKETIDIDKVIFCAILFENTLVVVFISNRRIIFRVNVVLLI